MPRRPSVLFLVEGEPVNPIPFYRGALPVRALQMRRWQAFHTSLGTLAPDGRFTSYSLDRPTDICVVRRPVNEDETTADISEHILKARAAGQRIYHDMDDDYFHIPPTNPARNVMTPESTQAFKNNLNACDGVICSTPGLATSLKTVIDAPVHVCPNGIDPGLYTPKQQEYKPLRIGWLGPWRWRNDDLKSAADWLVPFLNDRIGKVEFYHIGATPNDDGKAADILVGLKMPVHLIAWHPFPALEQAIKQVDVMFIPQRLGGSWEAFANARSPTSAIASIASGVVVWATPIDSYRRFFGDALPETPEQIVDDSAARRHYRREQKKLLVKVNLEATAIAYEKVFLNGQ